MDHAEELLRQLDGFRYVYDNGCWYQVNARKVRATPKRPAGLKYSLAFFNEQGDCLIRFDNAHGVKIPGRKNPAAFDHWHRFSNNELVPYDFVDVETLLEDFFRAIDGHLPPELRSG